ncbi:MAG TPA: hypothetical protein VLA71_11465 [Algoriphagus sp.]|nr:hypothetical protein [Algoriphagus sp.]
MKWLLTLLFIALMSACELSEDNSKTYQIEEIDELYSEIISLSESIACTNSSDWTFTPMGSKACGGPTHFIAYHQDVAEEILDLVEQYTKLQAEYNRKHNIISDCALLAGPKSVSCEGGKPILVY